MLNWGFTNKRNCTCLISPAEYLLVCKQSDKWTLVKLWIVFIMSTKYFQWPHAVAQLFVALRKASGSIPDCVTGIFHLHNPSGRTLVQGCTQPLKEMNTGNISWRVKVALRRAENISTCICRLSSSLGASTFWNPQGLYRGVQELFYLGCFTYLLSVTCRNFPSLRCDSAVILFCKVSTFLGKIILSKLIVH